MSHNECTSVCVRLCAATVCVCSWNGTLLVSPLVSSVWSLRPHGSSEALQFDCLLHTETNAHTCAYTALPSTASSNRHYIKGISVGPKTASLFIHSMSDINKMTCSHSNTPFCHFQFPAYLQMEHRWLYQACCSPWLTKHEWKRLNFT